MANSKISALTSATTPLAGTETLPVVQSSATTQVSVANLTVGRIVAASVFNPAFGSVGAPSVTFGTETTTGFYRSGANTISFSSAGVIGVSFGATSTSFAGGITGGSGYQVSGFTSYRASGASASSPGDASMYYNSTTGQTFQARAGSSYDWSLINPGNANYIAQVPTGTLDFRIAGGNVIQGTAAKGFNFTANTPASGMTSQLLNWYEQGTWTPSTAFATFVGAASSSGTYTRVGRQVTVNGTLTGATSVTVGASGILTTSLPFNASYDAIGSMAASTNTASGVVRVTGPYVVAVTTIAPVTSITFTATYFV